MIKGVLIYDTKSGLKVYHKYNKNDLLMSPGSLASFIHMIKGVESSGNEVLKSNLKDLVYHQFRINLSESLKITDSNKVHNNIQFHEINGFAGVFSADDNVSPEMTYPLFKLITQKLRVKNENYCLSLDDESRIEVDNFLKEYYN